MERVAVLGEWGVGNEWSGQRWLENDDRGKLERRDRSCGIVRSTLFFIVCNEFLFLKKNDDGDVSRPIVVGLSV